MVATPEQARFARGLPNRKKATYKELADEAEALGLSATADMLRSVAHGNALAYMAHTTARRELGLASLPVEHPRRREFARATYDWSTAFTMQLRRRVEEREREEREARERTNEKQKEC